jgi:hypothetical protein
MAAPRTCPRCGGLVHKSAVRCENCGASARSPFTTLWITLALAAITLIGAFAVWKWVAPQTGAARGGKRADSRVAAEIEPVAGKPALDVPGVMSVRYRDLGGQVEIGISAEGMPILYADVDGDGVVNTEGNDLSYAVYPNGSVCVQRLVSADSAQCGDASTSANVRVSGDSGGWNVVWTISKRELSNRGDRADVTFQIFRESDQRGRFYPGPPFVQVCRLLFSKTPSALVAQTSTPPPSLVPGAQPLAQGSQPRKPEEQKPARPSVDERVRADEKAQREREAARDQELERQRQEFAALKALQEQQQLQIDEARKKLADEQAQREREAQAQRERERKARDEAPKVFRPDPVSPAVPNPAPASYSGPSSGEIVWEGDIKGTELITIENGRASSGTVSGALPGVLCLLQPADPKRVSIASTPAPYNQYKRMVFRVSANGRTRVVIRWSLP